ncbi:MAG: hypothetical protein LBU48_03255 [Coriobacteriales bacterium]|jgi:hypothetical protein|nr:hypothetical protein [Coriobacteriales bacterium]
MSILDEYALGSVIFGGSAKDIVYKPSATAFSQLPSPVEIAAKAVSASTGGYVIITVDDSEPCTVETDVAVEAGDTVTVALVGTTMRVTAVQAGGDRANGYIQGALSAATEAANSAVEALAEAQMAQDKATAAESAALTASQEAAAAQTLAQATQNDLEAQAIEVANAKKTADDAALAALLARLAAEATESNLNTFREETTVNIEETADSILLGVASRYATAEDLDGLSASLQAQLAVRDSEISLSFQQQAQAVGEVSEEFAADVAERASYYRFSGERMEIGREESSFQTVLDNTHMGFEQDGTEIAAFYNNRMYVQQLEAQSGLTMGAENLGLYDWIQKANGNLSLKYRGAS